MIDKIKNNKSYIIIGVIILLIISVFVCKKILFNKPSSIYNESTNVIPIYKTYKVYNFGSKFCPACTKMDPIYEKIKEEYSSSLNFEYIDVSKDDDKTIELATKYEIQYTPTFVVVDDSGQKVDQLIGYTSESNFREFIDKWSKK